MARTQFTSMEAYRKHVLSGKATSQTDRIMRFVLLSGKPVTRSQIYKTLGKEPVAGDFGAPIPMSSVCGRVNTLINSGYLRVDHEGKCPITGSRAQFVAPVDGAWEQRRMF